MPSLFLIIAASLAFACSGLPALFLPARGRAGQRVAAALMCAGGLLGLAGLALPLAAPGSAGAGFSSSFSAPWTLPWGGLALALDPLGAVFLALVFIVPPLGSIYGLGYWRMPEKARGGRRLALSYGLLAAAMVVVVLARDGMLFLIAWELMALAAFFASTAEDGPEVRRAGWIYLIATHIGTLLLFAMFALWRRATGSFSLEAALGLPSEAAGAIFVLALLGFGFKAGFVPLHAWLPGAHANAPSHVSAVMSGVMLKMGVYGILRVSSLMPQPPAWWGASLLAVGAATGLAGIIFAMGQTDIKRVLAYSSVENIGVIAMGMGLGLLGSATGRSELVLLGLGGALLHVWNHGLFKPLLFFGAGAVTQAAGTRDIEKLGGLAKRMPVVAALFLAGAVAICALPPMNGFASEWLLYLGFFMALGPDAAGSPSTALAASGAVALAMIGALALACFVRLFGSVFLGTPRGAGPRGEAGARSRDSGKSMLGPMIALALGCAAIGLFPALIVPAALAAARGWAFASPGLFASASPAAALARLAPLGWISGLGLGLIALCALIALATRRPRRRAARGRPTWDCGYAAPTARMQYSASSFGRGIVGLFAPMPVPKARRLAVKGFFPEALAFEGDRPGTIAEKLVLPAAGLIDRLLPRFRLLQRGQTHLYLLYVLAITILLLAFGGLGGPQ